MPKSKLLKALQSLREKYIELEEAISQLKAENAKLKEQLKSEKIKSVNKNANKPSSKQAEWEEKGVGNDGKGKSKGKGRGKKPRRGAGNRAKNAEPSRTEKATVDECSLCGKDLTDQPPLESCNERIIEDIPDPIEKPNIIKVVQEKKYCNNCQEVITAKSELALPKADIGLNATILICYLWVAICLPFTKIQDYLKAFYGLERCLKRLKKRLEDLLNWPNANDILKKIIKKVKRQQPRILTFVEHPGAPCHNNYGEFLIRIGVLKRKISGGSVSAEGANAYAILLSIYVTCKLREISFPKYMKESLRHYIRTGKPMLLSTYSKFFSEVSQSEKAA